MQPDRYKYGIFFVYAASKTADVSVRIGEDRRVHTRTFVFCVTTCRLVTEMLNNNNNNNNNKFSCRREAARCFVFVCS